ncbi:MAG: CUAEP/CCAEP-tail radical SAM protein [bacterium]
MTPQTSSSAPAGAAALPAWKAEGAVVLASCYELGRQPLGLASPLAILRRAGYRPRALDVAVDPFSAAAAAGARFFGVSVPMHTALRLGVALARQARAANPDCHICFYGLYALLNADYLLENGADSVIGGEVEAPLLALIDALAAGRSASSAAGVGTRERAAPPHLEKPPLAPPHREGLPDLRRYARLAKDGELLTAGAVEASRGCKHLCRHCPIPPVYGGRFFAVPREIVLEDVRRLAAAGARHITFADPDFLNGPTHALRVAREMHAAFPGLTFDFTAKVEHLIRHADLLAEFRALGCLFVISAVESLSDAVLENLEKDHTRAEVFRALEAVRRAGLSLRPTFVAFTPWTEADDYFDLLDFVEREGLIDEVDPVQFAIRLLIPPGSHLLERPGLLPTLGPLDAENFIHRWGHPDPRMDRLHEAVLPLSEEAAEREEDSALTIGRIRALAAEILERPERAGPLGPAPAPDRLRPPRMTESWFC